MHIDSYKFGEIIINGQKYKKDVIILNNKVLSPWWRREGHSLLKEDLIETLRTKPEILIIGNGAVGMMKMTEELREFIEEKGIQCLGFNTAQACNEFNKFKDSGEKVAAALHLTC